MDADRFHELLNEYLDGEISGEGLSELNKAIEEQPNYRKLFYEYQRIRIAEKAFLTGRVSAKIAKPAPFSLLTGFFSPRRILRSAGVLTNCSILLLTVGLYRTSNFEKIETPVYSGFADSGAVITGDNALGSDSLQSGAAKPILPPDSAVSKPADLAESTASPAYAGDAGILAEEYGFVRF